MNILLYLIISFVIPWAIWIVMNAYGLFGSSVYMAVSAILMWLPAVSAAIVHLVRKTPMIRYSWRSEIRKNTGCYLIAWFSPLFLAFAGCIVYFSIFRNDFSLASIEMTAMTVSQFMLITVAAIIPAALFNMLFALGEEIGWRGFLYPELSDRVGKAKACLITGIIWGLWHTPINIMGYNYGLGYPGYPVSGIAAMCLSCIVLGTWGSYLADRTDSIWAPALFHGSINASGALGLVFMRPDAPYLLGPGITGIIPSIIAGLVLVPVCQKACEKL